MTLYKQKPLQNTPYYEVSIKGDYNDADYSTETTIYNQEYFDESAPYIYLLLKDYSKNHQLEDFPHTEYVGLPYSDNGICHSLEEVKIMYYDENGKASIIEFEFTEENTDKVYELIEDED